MINSLDIPSYKKSHGQGLTLPGTVKGKECIKRQKGSGSKILK